MATTASAGSAATRPARSVAVVGGGGDWGSTGWLRMLGSEVGGQVGWLLPAACLLLVVGSAGVALRERLAGPLAGLVVWGGWLLVTAATFSFMQGIFHAYYTVALAPAIAAVVAIGATLLWRRRDHYLGRRSSWRAAVAVATLTSFVLLGRSADFMPWLRWVVLVLRARYGAGTRRRSTPAPTGAAVDRRRRPGVRARRPGGVLGADRVDPAHGLHPVSAGPRSPAPSGLAVAASRAGCAARHRPAARSPAAAPARRRRFPRRRDLPRWRHRPRWRDRSRRRDITRRWIPRRRWWLLDGSTPSAALTKLLETDADSYTWVAATIGSNNASGYQLATQLPVMPIGGFNGSDPSPTLAQFKAYVAAGKIHYFIASGGGGLAPGGDGSSSITSWVTSTLHRADRRRRDGLRPLRRCPVTRQLGAGPGSAGDGRHRRSRRTTRSTPSSAACGRCSTTWPTCPSSPASRSRTTPAPTGRRWSPTGWLASTATSTSLHVPGQGSRTGAEDGLVRVDGRRSRLHGRRPLDEPQRPAPAGRSVAQRPLGPVHRHPARARAPACSVGRSGSSSRGATTCCCAAPSEPGSATPSAASRRSAPTPPSGCCPWCRTTAGSSTPSCSCSPSAPVCGSTRSRSTGSTTRTAASTSGARRETTYAASPGSAGVSPEDAFPLSARAHGRRAGRPRCSRRSCASSRIGVVSTIGYALVFLILRSHTSAVLANVTRAVVDHHAQHGRQPDVDVRRPRAGARRHPPGPRPARPRRSGSRVTTTALSIASDAGVSGTVAELVVLTAANLLVTVGRFAAFRLWVFRSPRAGRDVPPAVRRADPASGQPCEGGSFAPATPFAQDQA